MAPLVEVATRLTSHVAKLCTDGAREVYPGHAMCAPASSNPPLPQPSHLAHGNATPAVVGQARSPAPSFFNDFGKPIPDNENLIEAPMHLHPQWPTTASQACSLVPPC